MKGIRKFMKRLEIGKDEGDRMSKHERQAQMGPVAHI
jgi:hypothetical protein